MSTLIAQRAYTLAEVDTMREAIRIILVRATPEIIEGRLRTYMMAGVTAEELTTKAEETVSQHRVSAYKAAMRKREEAGEPPLTDPRDMNRRREVLNKRLDELRDQRND